MKSEEQIKKTLRESKENGSKEWSSELEYGGWIKALEWVMSENKVDNWPFDNMKPKRTWPWFQE
jgi:hypothetical protein